MLIAFFSICDACWATFSTMALFCVHISIELCAPTGLVGDCVETSVSVGLWASVGDERVFIVGLVEGGGRGCRGDGGEGAFGVGDGDAVGVGVEGTHEVVEPQGEVGDVDKASEGTAIDGDGGRLVNLQDYEVGEVAREGVEDDGRAYLGRDEKVLAVVEFGGTQAHTGNVDVTDGDGAGDAFDGFDDALQDGGTLGYERCDGIA